tara:strand:+ start:595 stop:2148 length:1554 start_codon:yes stop_codon:yes gene_type:complete
MVEFKYRGNFKKFSADTKNTIQEDFYNALTKGLDVDVFLSYVEEAFRTLKDGTKEELGNFIQNAIDEKMKGTTIEKAFRDAGILKIYQDLSKGSEKSQDMGYIKQVMKNFDKSLKDLESDSSLQKQIELRSKDVKPDSVEVMGSKYSRFNQLLKDILLSLQTAKGKGVQSGFPFVSKRSMKTSKDLIRFAKRLPNKKGEDMIQVKDAIIFKTTKEFIDWKEETKKNLLLEEGLFSTSRKGNRKNKKQVNNLQLAKLSDTVKFNAELLKIEGDEERNEFLTNVIFKLIEDNDAIIKEYLRPIINDPYIISSITLKITPKLKRRSKELLTLAGYEKKVIFKYINLKELTKTDLDDAKQSTLIELLQERKKNEKGEDTLVPITKISKNQRREFLENTFGKNEFVEKVIQKLNSGQTANDKMFEDVIEDLDNEGKPVQVIVTDGGFAIEDPTKDTFTSADKTGIRDDSQRFFNLVVDLDIEFNYEKILRIEPTTLKSEDANKVEAFMDKLADIVDELEDLR